MSSHDIYGLFYAHYAFTRFQSGDHSYYFLKTIICTNLEWKFSLKSELGRLKIKHQTTPLNPFAGKYSFTFN